jgi:hypothetical protein
MAFRKKILIGASVLFASQQMMNLAADNDVKIESYTDIVQERKVIKDSMSINSQADQICADIAMKGVSPEKSVEAKCPTFKVKRSPK